MKTLTRLLFIAIIATSLFAHGQTTAPQAKGKAAMKRPMLPAGIDSRNIATGLNIPSEGYADRPYIEKTDDGAR